MSSKLFEERVRDQLKRQEERKALEKRREQELELARLKREDKKKADEKAKVAFAESKSRSRSSEERFKAIIEEEKKAARRREDKHVTKKDTMDSLLDVERISKRLSGGGGGVIPVGHVHLGGGCGFSVGHHVRLGDDRPIAHHVHLGGGINVSQGSIMLPVRGCGVGFINPGGVSVVRGGLGGFTVQPYTGTGAAVMLPGLPGFYITSRSSGSRR